ncbi:MAG: ChaN family lipoprotein [Pyrinomonadaceae bacterium]|nr:ChaN family lipoprotein [Pyrinomonadaceae bacterium]
MSRMLIFVFALLVLSVTAQNDEKFRIYDAKGERRSFEQVIEAMKLVDVVFVGESHDDEVAHKLQLELLKAAFDRIRSKQIVLAMEMFERDVQVIIDEYLQDLITEAHFLSSSRPWNNYKTDYRPLVEFAKENKLKVIASNAPRRYVNMVSRRGKSLLEMLSPEARRWIAPLPYKEASKAYAEKFSKIMGINEHQSANNLLEAQTLWDATMAFSISEVLKANSKALVIHINGAFHSENRLGAPEHLASYLPNVKFLVITIRRETKSLEFDKSKHLNLGDFVIITN